MKTGTVIFTALIAASISFTSCSTTEPGESSGEKKHYTEQYRPQFHFSPDSMWMNDPNGMVYYEGEYHLFYQYHPHSNVWGPMHWGHAISADLIHWEHLPIALYPDSLGTIFSGSAVIDWKNSSGLGSSVYPPMVAIFTHHNQDLAEEGSLQFQYQSIAYSLDKGRSWTKYEGNPVLSNPGIRDFRDPKVSWSDVPSEDGRRIFLGWMSNWQYANQVPTERWRSAMTLPRELKLGTDEQGYLLNSIPVLETEQLRTKQYKLEPGVVKDRMKVGPVIDDAWPLYEIDLVFEFDPHVEEELEFGILLESDQHERLLVVFNTQDQEVSIARHESGEVDFSEHFPGIHTAPYRVSEAGEISFHAFIDLSSIELFVDQGKVIMTELCFPESGFEEISLYANKESVVLKSGTIYCLKSVW